MKSSKLNEPDLGGHWRLHDLSKERVKSYSGRSTLILLAILKTAISLLDIFSIFIIGLLLSVSLGKANSNLTIPLISKIINNSAPELVVMSVIALVILSAFMTSLLNRKILLRLAKNDDTVSKLILEFIVKSRFTSLANKSDSELILAQGLSARALSIDVQYNILNAVVESFVLVTVLLALIVVSPTITLIAALYFGFAALIIHRFVTRGLRQSGAATLDGHTSSINLLEDLLGTLSELRILGRVKNVESSILHARQSGVHGHIKSIQLLAYPRLIVETSLLIGLALVALASSTREDFVSQIPAISIFVGGSIRLVGALIPLQGALAALAHAREEAVPAASLINRSALAQKEELFKLDGVSGVQIENPIVNMSDVSFRYDDGSIGVSSVNLEIPFGNSVAFIGPSGAGKSTLAKLVLGLLSPQEGLIEIGGMTPRSYLRKMPGSICYVPQNPKLISGSIAMNVALGIPESEINLDQVSRALETANLPDLVADLTDLTRMPKGGRYNLSGGQIQRISLARALYSMPKILIMDEATSALDSVSEREITEALAKLKGKMTIITVAHRLTTIQKADKVYYLSQGKIHAAGSFDRLRRENRKVQQLVKNLEFEQDEGSF